VKGELNLTLFRRFTLGLLIVLVCHTPAVAQFASTLTGVGPINRSMGGASTAAPLDTLGAFLWNPATITALPTQTDFGVEVIIPNVKLSSRVNAGSLGPGSPPVTLSGSDRSDCGAFPLPEFGLVFRPDNSPLSLGLGLLSVAGFGVNFPGDPHNPVLSPPPPFGLGAGPVSAQYQLMQLIPTAALQATERLSLGFSPIVDIAGLSADPGSVAPPDNASGSGFPTFPPLTHSTLQWGGGFQVGGYYITESRWQLGASFKSTQWFNSFQFNSRDQIGAPRNIKVNLDAPMIVSIGAAYAGFERSLIALDLRYLDYSNTRTFGPVGFDSTGAVKGLGWDNVFALSTGTQYQVTDTLAARVGYSYGTNPISNNRTFFNIASPTVIQHSVYFGVSYDVTATFKLSIAYAHFFENSVSGPLISPLAGPLAGTSVTATASGDSILAGGSFKF
jgi:long-chain fatty acid transport protein